MCSLDHEACTEYDGNLTQASWKLVTSFVKQNFGLAADGSLIT